MDIFSLLIWIIILAGIYFGWRRFKRRRSGGGDSGSGGQITSLRNFTEASPARTPQGRDNPGDNPGKETLEELIMAEVARGDGTFSVSEFAQKVDLPELEIRAAIQRLQAEARIRLS